jgi:hypothetical protein
MNFLSKLFQFVIATTAKRRIDESHGLSHAMDVLVYANRIYEEQVHVTPVLKEYERVIYVAAMLHDMCDKKYMNEKEGLCDIQEFLCDKLTPSEITDVSTIISTMSYSKVKRVGFPDIGTMLPAYHVVREADLLAAYDYDRCLVYHLSKATAFQAVDDPKAVVDFDAAIKNANEIFHARILRHNEDGLFFTEFGKRESRILHEAAMHRMYHWRRVTDKVT